MGHHRSVLHFEHKPLSIKVSYNCSAYNETLSLLVLLLKAPAKYDFDWAVNDAASGNDFGHQESRDGDFTQGSYYVLLPDGRLQRVNYNVDGDSGFVAEVTYEGEARAYTPPQPSYAPPSPNYGGK
ncbi:pro-resilin-like [Oratosquilla oratoria]|uniref:pro-resilin-like n=1 Tax=Oratosquilla oratoria TaxID=337810 RepID=UPI003F75F6F8